MDDALCRYFEDRWGLAAGWAQAASREAIHFWDEAGVFVLDSGGRIEARVQSFADLAAAQHLVTMAYETQQDSIDQLLSDVAGAREPLLLAMGLSGAVAEQLAGRALIAEDLELQLLLAEGIRQGAKLPHEIVRRLVLSLLSVTDAGADWRQLVRALTSLPVPLDLHPAVLRRFERSVPADLQPFVRFLALQSWNAPASAVDEAAEVALSASVPQHRKRTGEMQGDPVLNKSTVLELFAPSQEFQQAVKAATFRLVPSRPDLVDRALLLAESCSMSCFSEIESFIRDLGHLDALRNIATRRIGRWSKEYGLQNWLRSGDDARQNLILAVSKMGTPRELSPGEWRRLDELADFLATLGIGDAAIPDYEFALGADLSFTTYLAEMTAALGDFDRDLLASQASRVLADSTDRLRELDYAIMLGDQPTRRTLDRWGRLDVVRAADALIGMLGAGDFVAEFAISLLEQMPRGGVEFEGQLEEVLARSRGRRRLVVAGLLESRYPRASRLDGWRRGDVPLRMAAAAFAAMRRSSAISGALLDQDAGVRVICLRNLHTPLGPQIEARLRDMLDAPDTGWECVWCGTENPTVEAACSDCQSSAPDPRTEAKRLLDVGRFDDRNVHLPAQH